jgi:nitrile hydratase accessory protein
VTDDVVEEVVPALTGVAALPRSNGELVFVEPWESRVFGMAVASCKEGAFKWDEFREQLIAEIGAAGEEGEQDYYGRWLAAFENLLISRRIVTGSEVDARVRILAEADDHPHDH